MRKAKIAKIAGAILLVCGLTLLTAVYFVKITKRAPFPNPNGYDDFVRAGEKIGKFPGRIEDFQKRDLEAFVQTNALALRMGFAALSNECRVPDNYEEIDFDQFRQNCEDTRYLAYGFAAQARLARMENRTNESIQSALACIQLGEKSYQGGLTVCRMIGIHSEELGFAELQLWPRLDASQYRLICKKLEKIDSEDDSVAETFAHDRSCSFQTTGGFITKIKTLFSQEISERDPANLFAKAFKENQLVRKSAMVGFAARAYELENGKKPEALTQLVPSYLKSIPQNPLTRSNLIYNP